MPGSLLPGGGASVTGKPAAGQASSALADDERDLAARVDVLARSGPLSEHLADECRAHAPFRHRAEAAAGVREPRDRSRQL